MPGLALLADFAAQARARARLGRLGLGYGRVFSHRTRASPFFAARLAIFNLCPHLWAGHDHGGTDFSFSPSRLLLPLAIEDFSFSPSRLLLPLVLLLWIAGMPRRCCGDASSRRRPCRRPAPSSNRTSTSTDTSRTRPRRHGPDVTMSPSPSTSSVTPRSRDCVWHVPGDHHKPCPSRSRSRSRSWSLRPGRPPRPRP